MSDDLAELSTEISQLRAEVERHALGNIRAVDDLHERLARVWTLLKEEPLIVSGIRRDMEAYPKGRGGALRHDPGCFGWGVRGCPGDNLLNWVNELRAAVGLVASDE